MLASNNSRLFLLVILVSMIDFAVLFLTMSFENAESIAQEKNAVRSVTYTNNYAQSSSAEVNVSADIPSLLLENKDIAISIILSLITFGIYSLFWAYSMIKKIRLVNKESTDVVGEFLCLIFVPFYAIYWLYTRGQKITKGAASFGVNVDDNSVIYLVLSLFGLSIVAYAMMQNDLNKIADALKTGNVSQSKNESPATTAREPETQKIDHIESLKKLAELRDSGVISTAEFEDKKKEILSRI
jgi:hypothetical protein